MLTIFLRLAQVAEYKCVPGDPHYVFSGRGIIRCQASSRGHGVSFIESDEAHDLINEPIMLTATQSAITAKMVV